MADGIWQDILGFTKIRGYGSAAKKKKKAAPPIQKTGINSSVSDYNRRAAETNRRAIEGLGKSDLANYIGEPDAGATEDPYAGLNSPVSEEMIRQQLRQSVNGQYNPQIDQLRQAMERARKRSGANQKDVAQLYNELASYYGAAGKAAHKDTMSALADVAQRTAGVRDTIKADRAETQNDLIAKMQQLGLGAAGATILPEQEKDLAEALQRATLAGQGESAAQSQLGRANENYYKQGTGIAKNMKADALASLKASLEDFLNNSDADIAKLTGQRESAFSSGLLEALSKNADTARQYANDKFNRDLALSKLAIEQQKANRPSGKLSPLDNAMAVLGNDPRLGSLWTKLLASEGNYITTPEFRKDYGGIAPNAITPEIFAAIMKRGAEKYGGIGQASPADINAIYQAALRYRNK